jgi:hypothetical protein
MAAVLAAQADVAGDALAQIREFDADADPSPAATSGRA